MLTRSLVVLAGCFLLSGSAQPALAAPGDIDTSFVDQGKLISNVGTHLDRVVIDKQNRILAGGEKLIRLLPTGKFDETFGNGGVVEGVSNTYDILIDGNDRILAITESDKGIAVHRFTTDGKIDPNFGAGGTATFTFVSPVKENLQGGKTLAMDSAGRIIVGGWAQSTLAFARLTPNGSLDATFGKNGLVLVASGIVTAMAVDKSDRIVAAGGMGNPYSTIIVRLKSNGALDESFGTNGKSVFNLAAYNLANGLALDADEKIWLAGDLTSQAYLARLSPNGVPDAAYGSGGVLAFDFGTATEIEALGRDLNGKWIVVGRTTAEVMKHDVVLARFSPAGALETGFGNGGKVTTDLGQSEDAYAIGVTKQNDLLVVGASVSGAYAPQGQMLILKYLGDTIADNTSPTTQCGNGTLETAEGCDDGNTNDGDGCSSTCMKETASAKETTATPAAPEAASASSGCNLIRLQNH